MSIVFSLLLEFGETSVLERTYMNRFLRFVVALALLTVASSGIGKAAVAAGDVLLMPDRDALAGTALVVWGNTAPGLAGQNYTIDFGDATSVGPLPVTDPSYVAVTHTYAAAGTYTVTMTVGGDSDTTIVKAFSGLSPENLRNLKINMAIEDGLRYLYFAQFNRAANYASATTSWSDGGSFPQQWTALVTLAFQNHGYKVADDGSAPTGIYERFIVRRGLNYVMQNLQTVALASQASGFAGQPVRDPCVGLAANPCTGLRPTSIDPGYATGLAMLPIAASGALNRVQNEVGGPANGQTYKDILQRLSNALAWGQADHNGPGRGGWVYDFNTSDFDGSTVGWALLGLLDAQAVGIIVPAWVKSEFAFGLTGALNDNGSLDYRANGRPVNDGQQTGNHYATNLEKAGTGLQGMFFIGEVGGARSDLTQDYISDRWNSGRLGVDYTGWFCNAIPNRGCAYAMFNNFKGLKLQGVTTLPGVGRAAGPGSIPANDWYADYQDWLVTNQTSPTTTTGGNWASMTFSGITNSASANAAIAELILSPVALVVPENLTLSPASATNILPGDTTHQVTAVATAASGSPVAGATVTFTVTAGPNIGTSGNNVTDSNGVATFTYTSNGNVGTDTIQAKIGNLASNTVTKTWSIVCDVDNDGDVDLVDINLINAARNTVAAAGDKRDANGDGLINVVDSRFCAVRRTVK